MPVIQMTPGKITREQKHELIKRLTQTAIEITGIKTNDFTISFIEPDYDNIGRAGRPLSEIPGDVR